MFLLSILDRIMVLHAGTSPVVSQTVLTLMLVVLGIVLVGIGFGYLVKSKEALLEHRWVLTASLALALGAVFFVMLPTTFNYYVDPDVEFFSPLSITTVVHGIVGFPAIVTALIYGTGDLPNNVKKWMRFTAVFWIASTLLGIILFLQMLEVI